jgi:predicted nucleic acid-binding Zn ribbon protein
MVSSAKKTAPTPLSRILPGVLRHLRTAEDAELIQIWQIWDEAVGTTIAQNAQPAAFKGSLLIVHVESSVWTQQLQFLKYDIIKRLNHALGDTLITDMRFKIGTL